MNLDNVTTPFGRRSLSLGMLATQFQAADNETMEAIDKWKLFRALCEARSRIGISDRALAVLNALMSFLPGHELDPLKNIVVFPSNQQLSLRAHGIAPATLRRHLADLVQCGLIIRKDSPNGKRYSRKDKDGAIEQAFGFSLMPLVARAEEIEQMAAGIVAERTRIRVLKEQISITRRDIAKLIETAMEEAVPGDWQGQFLSFRAVIDGLPRQGTPETYEDGLAALVDIRKNILKRMENHLNFKKPSANDSHFEHHIQNSKSETLIELEPAKEKKQGENLGLKLQDLPEPIKAFPLRMVLSACPQILDYGPGGQIGHWRDLMGAAVVVRSMLGVSPSAYQEACEILGPENAAAVMACILERAGHINSPGGYLRTLTERAKRGEFSLGPMIMALMRANGMAEKRAG